MPAKSKSPPKDSSATIGTIFLVCTVGLRPSHKSDEGSATVTDRRYSYRAPEEARATDKESLSVHNTSKGG